MILWTPGLADRLSVIRADGAFHIATGIALLVAAAVRGDGSLRWLEAAIGLAMFWVGVHKARQFADIYLQHIGIGLAYMIGRMSSEQIKIAAGILTALKRPNISSQSAAEGSASTEQHGGAAASSE